MVLIIPFPFFHSISKYKKGVLLISGLAAGGGLGFFFLLPTAATQVFLALFCKVQLMRDTGDSLLQSTLPFPQGSGASPQLLGGFHRELYQIKQKVAQPAVSRKHLLLSPVMLLSTNKCLWQGNAAVLIVMDLYFNIIFKYING